MPISPLDIHLLGQAQAQSEQALGLSAPNPRVGCVLARPDGQVVGLGFTQQAGGPHAEVMALRDAASRGLSPHGATAYVTLEPCSHHGRTGPCCEALLAAGIARTVVSLQDPNPKVAGQGLARLAAAGVDVTVIPGAHPLAQAARTLNIGFLSRMVRRRPWVRMKAAVSLDGLSALPNGQSQWITGAAARADGHHWRARAGAILTGVGTILADNARLDVRLAPVHHQPTLVLLDRQLRTPPNAALLDVARPTLIYTSPEAHATQHSARAALEQRGASVLPWMHSDLPQLMRELGQREVNELHVEAGATLNGALLQAGLVDELLVYIAPRLLGSGRGLADWLPPNALAEDPPLRIVSSEMRGNDLRLLLRFTDRDDF